jgi:hypothetical protein
MFLRQLGVSPPALDVTAADRAGVLDAPGGEKYFQKQS